MTHSNSEIISSNSLVTLHYRIRQSEGAILISTFESQPATLQLGQNELSPKLEQALLGLKNGEKKAIHFAAGEIFGMRHPDLVGRIPREDLPINDEIDVHTVISFTGPDGNPFSGLVLELDEHSALIDFNHPLAGKAVEFDVEIIGVL